MKQKIKLLYVLMIISSGISITKGQTPNLKRQTAMGFIKNQGQVYDQNFKSNPAVKYLFTSTSGLNVQLKQTGFSYDTYIVEKKTIEKVVSLKSTQKQSEPAEELTYKYHRIDIELIGANPNAHIIEEAPSKEYYSFFTTDTPEKGITGLHKYQKITYKEIYPSIDLEFLVNQGGNKPVEYNFIIKEGGDINKIQLKYIGQDSYTIDKDRINIQTSFGKLVESIPASWIKETKEKQLVQYKTINQSANEFTVGLTTTKSLKKGGTLIIDPAPTLEYATYFGGSNAEQLMGMAIDPVTDAVYISGRTNSPSLATAGTFLTTITTGASGGLSVYDATISKFNADGIRIWTTYFGGTQEDCANNIAYVPTQGVFVIGRTYSTTNITTSGSYEETFPTASGTYAIFITKFSLDGTARNWGTYYGRESETVYTGSHPDIVASHTALYITASSYSDSKIVAGSTPIQTTCAGITDITVAKFNFLGNIIWGTYVGTDDYDVGAGISIDLSENIYITGYSKKDGLGTAGVAQQNFYPLNGAYLADAFLMKINPSGVKQWFTYLGGEGWDIGTDVACATNGKVYLVANTQSANNVASAGAYKDTKPGTTSNVSTILACYNTTNGTKNWSTYIGGTAGDGASSVAITCNNEAVVAMTVKSTGLALSNAYQTTYGGDEDIFLTKYNDQCVPQWATYYGGSEGSRPNDVKINSKFKIWTCGRIITANASLITPNAFQPSIGGLDDALLAIFSEVNIAGTKVVCQNDSIKLTAEISTTGTPITYNWSGPNLASGTNSTLIIPNAQAVNAGIYSVTVTVNGTCSYVKTDSVKVNPQPTPTASVITPICVGDSVKLSSTGGVSYTWTGPNTFTSILQNPVITPSLLTSGGIYTVIATNSNGCTASAQATLVVNDRPAITLTTNSPVCEQGTINLSCTPNSQTGYAWSGPSYTSTTQNPSIINATELMEGTYSVTVTNSFGCTSSKSSVVVINPKPVATATSNSPICENGSINLSAGPVGQTSYNWLGISPLTYNAWGITQTISSVTPSMSGNYSVIVTNSFGCKDTAQVAVVVNANPVATASSNTPICTGDTLWLNGGVAGETSYSWSGPLSFTGSYRNWYRANTLTTHSGIYTITVTNTHGCTSTAQTTAVVNPRPTVTATSNAPICEGDTLKLSSSGGTICTWSGVNSYSSNSEDPIIASAIPSMSGLYTVVITNGFGCTSSAGTSPVINPKPVAVLSSSPAICSGYPLNLYAEGGVNYAWIGPNGFSSSDQNPLINNVSASDSGLYVVFISNSFLCKDTAEINVIVHANPTPTILSNSPICAYDSIRLSSTGGVSYLWNGVNSYNSIEQNPIIHTSDTTLSGNYSVTATNEFGCTTSISTTVDVRSNPKPILTNNSPICMGDTLQFSSSAGETYHWTGPLAYNDTTRTSSITNTNTLMSGYYTQTIRYLNGCINNDSILVIVYPNPVLNIRSDTTVCQNQEVLVWASGVATYLWNNGNTTPAFLVSPTTDISYSLVGTDTNGCKSSGSVVVTIYPYVDISITQNPAGTIFKDQIVTYSALPEGYNNYSFYLNNVLVQNSGSNTYTTSTLTDQDKIQVFTTHPSVCFNEPIFDVKVIGIYNSFSPNDDGINDLFLKGYQITVFNRWGDIMYQGVDGWDGKFNGTEVNTGTYYFTINYFSSDRKEIEYKGTMMLVR